MNAAKAKDDNPRMKAADFDRIMRQALQVAPPEDKKAKGPAKTKKPSKKKTARK